MLLIIAFINLDVSWAYPLLSEDDMLGAQSIFQSEMMTREAVNFKGSVLSDARLLTSVFAISDFLLGSSLHDGTPLPVEFVEHLETVIKGELPKDTYEGIDLEQVATLEYWNKYEPEKLKEALRENDFPEGVPEKNLAVIPYTNPRTGEEFLILVGQKNDFSEKDLPGYRIFGADRYMVKVLPKNYRPLKESEKTPETDAEKDLKERDASPKKKDTTVKPKFGAGKLRSNQGYISPRTALITLGAIGLSVLLGSSVADKVGLIAPLDKEPASTGITEVVEEEVVEFTRRPLKDLLKASTPEYTRSREQHYRRRMIGELGELISTKFDDPMSTPDILEPEEEEGLKEARDLFFSGLFPEEDSRKRVEEMNKWIEAEWSIIRPNMPTYLHKKDKYHQRAMFLIFAKAPKMYKFLEDKDIIIYTAESSEGPASSLHVFKEKRRLVRPYIEINPLYDDNYVGIAEAIMREATNLQFLLGEENQHPVAWYIDNTVHLYFMEMKREKPEMLRPGFRAGTDFIKKILNITPSNSEYFGEGLFYKGEYAHGLERRSFSNMKVQLINVIITSIMLFIFKVFVRFTSLKKKFRKAIAEISQNTEINVSEEDVVETVFKFVGERKTDEKWYTLSDRDIHRQLMEFLAKNKVPKFLRDAVLLKLAMSLQEEYDAKRRQEEEARQKIKESEERVAEKEEEAPNEEEEGKSEVARLVEAIESLTYLDDLEEFHEKSAQILNLYKEEIAADPTVKDMLDEVEEVVRKAHEDREAVKGLKEGLLEKIRQLRDMDDMEAFESRLAALLDSSHEKLSKNSEVLLLVEEIKLEVFSNETSRQLKEAEEKSLEDAELRRDVKDDLKKEAENAMVQLKSRTKEILEATSKKREEILEEARSEAKRLREEVKTEIQDLEIRNKKLDDRILSKLKELSLKQREVKRLEKQAEELKEKIAAFSSQTEEAGKALNAAQERKEREEEESGRASERKSILLKEIDEVQILLAGAKKELEAAQKEAEETKRQNLSRVEELKEKIATLVSQAEESGKALNAAQEKKEREEEESGRASERKSILLKEIDEAQILLGGAKKELEAIHKESEKAQEEDRARMAELKSEILILNSQMEEVRKELKEAGKRKQQEEEETLQISESKAVLKEEISELIRAKEELMGVQKQAEITREENRAEIASLKSEMAALNAQVEEARKELNNAQQIKQHEAQATEQIIEGRAIIEKEIENLQTALKQSKEKLIAVEKHAEVTQEENRTRTERLKSEISKLNAQLEESRKELSDTERRKKMEEEATSETIERRSAVEKEIAALNAQAEEARRTLDDVHAEIEADKQAIEGLNKHRSNLEKNISEDEETLERINGDIERGRKEIALLERHIQEVKQVASEAEERRKVSEASMGKLEEEIKKFDEYLRKMKEEASRAERAKEEAKQAAIEALKARDEAEAHLVELKKNHEFTVSRLSIANNEKQYLDKEVTEAEDKLTELWQKAIEAEQKSVTAVGAVQKAVEDKKQIENQISDLKEKIENLKNIAEEEKTLAGKAAEEQQRAEKERQAEGGALVEAQKMLSKARDEAEKAKERKTAFENDIIHLQDKVKELRDKEELLTVVVHQVISQKEELEKAVSAKAAELSEKQKKNEHLDKLAKEALIRSDEIAKKNQEEEAKAKERKAVIERDITELQNTVASLKEQQGFLTGKVQELQKLDEQRGMLEEEISDKSREVAERSKVLEELIPVLKDIEGQIEASKHKHNEILKAIETAKAGKTEIDKSLEVKKQKLTEVKNEIIKLQQQAETIIGEAETKKEELEELEKAVSAKAAELSEKQKKNEHLDKLAKEALIRSDEIAKKNQEEEAKAKERKAVIERDITELQNTVASLKEQQGFLTGKVQELQKLDEQRGMLEEEISDKSREVAERSKVLEELIPVLKDIEGQIEASKHKHNEILKAIETAKAGKEEIDKNLEDKSQRLTQVKKEIVEAETIIEEARERIEEIHKDAQKRAQGQKVTVLAAIKNRSIVDYDRIMWEFFPTTPYTESGLSGIINRSMRQNVRDGAGRTIYLEIEEGGQSALEVEKEYGAAGIDAYMVGENIAEINRLTGGSKFFKEGTLIDIIAHMGSLDEIENPRNLISCFHNNLKEKGILVAAYTLSEEAYESKKSFLVTLEDISSLFDGYVYYKNEHIDEEGVYLVTLVMVRESAEVPMNLGASEDKIPPKAIARYLAQEAASKETITDDSKAGRTFTSALVALTAVVTAFSLAVILSHFNIRALVNIADGFSAMKNIDILSPIIGLAGLLGMVTAKPSGEEKPDEFKRILEDIMPIPLNLITQNAKAGSEKEKEQNLAIAVKEAAQYIPMNIEGDVLDLIQEASQRDYGVDDEVLAYTLRIVQLVHLSRSPVMTDLNLVRYPWAGDANRIMYGLDAPEKGENNIAEVWHNSTVIKDGKENNPSIISNTAITVGDVELEPVHLRGLIDVNPKVLGGDHKEKPFFVKFLSTRFEDKVRMGFHDRMFKIGKDQFIEWLIEERKNVEELQSALREGLTREEFTEYLKAYEKWVLFQDERGWRFSPKSLDILTATRGISPFIKEGVNISELLHRTAQNRSRIVSALNEIWLKPGMVVVSPAGHPHYIDGLSAQTHPTKVFVNEKGEKEYPKNEAWAVISVKDENGRDQLIMVEPQQTSNNTYSFADFYTPIEWKTKDKDGKAIPLEEQYPGMRKDVTGDDIKGFVEKGLYTERTTIPEDFIQEPRDITPAEGVLHAKVETLIEDDPLVWPTQHFIAHRITLEGKGEEDPSGIVMYPVKHSFHELIVTKGEVTLKIVGRPDIKLTRGTPLFIPSEVGRYALESQGEAEIIKFYPVEESYRDIESQDVEELKAEEKVPEDDKSPEMLFKLVESTVNNRRTRLVEAANKLINYLKAEEYLSPDLDASPLDREAATALLIERMQEVLSLVDELGSFNEETQEYLEELPDEVVEYASDIRANFDQLEVDSTIASMMILARRLKRKGRKLTIGLETDWVPGLEEGKWQQKALTISGHLKDPKKIVKLLKSMGLDVNLVHKERKESITSWVKKMVDLQEDSNDLSGIVVLGSKNTIEFLDSEVLSDLDNDKRAFLAGINSSKLDAFYGENGEDEDNQLVIEIMKMLSLALELASGKREPDLSIIQTYDEEMRMVIFLPEAKPVEYTNLQKIYKLKRLARQSV